MMRALLLLFVSLVPLSAYAQDAGVEEDALPDAHKPNITMQLDPRNGAVAVGQKLRVVIEASALEGDDVTVPEQSFAPLELVGKNARVLPAKDGRQTFVFELDFISLTPGVHAMESTELAVVTKQGLVGRIKSGAFKVEVKSLIGNEPNAKLREPTKPVVVMQDDYTLLYVGGGLLAALLLAGLSVLVYRYLQRRVKPLPPPPPPRPPWEIAIEKLAALRRRKAEMIAAGQAGLFVDQVSDVVRAYLGGRFHFDGLESTSDELLAHLRKADCSLDLFNEVGSFLRRCDLVKFAKVEPDAQEADWVLLKAQEIVQLGDTARATSQAAPSPSPAAGGAT
jgi:hypothetical protein